MLDCNPDSKETTVYLSFFSEEVIYLRHANRPTNYKHVVILGSVILGTKVSQINFTVAHLQHKCGRHSQI
jgi:hypothetical protein